MAQKDVAEKQVKNIENEAVEPSKAELFCAKKSLYSTKSFMELQLSEELQKGIYCLNYQTPSKVQEAVLTLMIGDPGRHLVVQSPSGTGKTAAFLLAALKRVNTMLNVTQVLILSSMPELTLQIADVAERMVKYSKITTRHVMIPQPSPLKEHLIIGTPEAVSVCQFDETERIVVLVIDEADWMVRSEAFDTFLEKLRLDFSTCQVMLFSATYDKQAMEFANRLTPSVQFIQFNSEPIPKNVSQYYAICNNENEKYSALSHVFGSLSVGQAFIFCGSKGSGKKLEENLTLDGHSVWRISDEMTVFGRTKVMERFKSGKERILIVENVVIRGVDVPQVTLVINYDLPYKAGTGEPDYKTYLHRVGRTGRFGKSGLAINLVDGSLAMRCIKKLENHFGCKIKKLDANDPELLEKIEEK